MNVVNVVGEWAQVFMLTLIAGVTMPVGAAIASIERIHPHWLETEVRHNVIVF